MRAKDIMRRRVLSLTPDMTLSEAERLFERQGISGAPVLGRDHELLGVVSQTDLLRRQEQQRTGEVPAFYKAGERIRFTTVTEEPGRARVAEVMTPAALCADEETPVEDLARFMLARRVHRVIITKGDSVRGIVTTMDMLRLIAVEGLGGRDESAASSESAAAGSRRARRGARRGAGRRRRGAARVRR